MSKHCACYFFTPLQTVLALGEVKVYEKQIGTIADWSVNDVVVHSPGVSQPVPLVPLTEANEEAMDNKSFRGLLRKLGMRAPANEQVCFCFLCYILLPNQSFFLILIIAL